MKPIAVHLALVAALTAGGLAAKESPCLTRTVMVNVTDPDGQMVEGLRRENFRAKYRGKPVEILKLETDMSQRRIVILLDASGTVTGSPLQWSLEKRLAADVVRASPSVVSFALPVFASEIEDKVSYAQGPLALASRLIALQGKQEMAPEGHRKTALFDAIVAALAELEPPQPGDVIYVITDGGENLSHQNSPSCVERALLAKGVRLFVLLIFEPLASRARTPDEIGGQQDMTSLAGHTGAGSERFPPECSCPTFASFTSKCGGSTASRSSFRKKSTSRATGTLRRWTRTARTNGISKPCIRAWFRAGRTIPNSL